MNGLVYLPSKLSKNTQHQQNVGKYTNPMDPSWERSFSRKRNYFLLYRFFVERTFSITWKPTKIATSSTFGGSFALGHQCMFLAGCKKKHQQKSKANPFARYRLLIYLHVIITNTWIHGTIRKICWLSVVSHRSKTAKPEVPLLVTKAL